MTQPVSCENLSWTFGDIELTRVAESEEPLLSPFEIYPDCTQAVIDENLAWMAPRFYNPASGLLVIAIQSFLLRTPEHVILIDTCAGNHKDRQRAFFHQREWPWLQRLQAAGVSPEDVDFVLCTHLHVDHVGWNTRLDNGRWVPTFPNARYLISRREWEYWRRESASDGVARTGDYVADSVLPVMQTRQARLVEDAVRLCSGVSAEPAPGHTPGHYVVRLQQRERGSALLTGDLFHHPLQLRYPQWSTRFCVDPVHSRVTRCSYLDALADSRTMVFPAHFPAPVGGRVVRVGDAFALRYDGEDTVIP